MNLLRLYSNTARKKNTLGSRITKKWLLHKIYLWSWQKTVTVSTAQYCLKKNIFSKEVWFYTTAEAFLLWTSASQYAKCWRQTVFRCWIKSLLCEATSQDVNSTPRLQLFSNPYLLVNHSQMYYCIRERFY